MYVDKALQMPKAHSTENSVLDGEEQTKGGRKCCYPNSYVVLSACSSANKSPTFRIIPRIFFLHAFPIGHVRNKPVY